MEPQKQHIEEGLQHARVCSFGSDYWWRDFDIPYTLTEPKHRINYPNLGFEDPDGKQSDHATGLRRTRREPMYDKTEVIALQ